MRKILFFIFSFIIANAYAQMDCATAISVCGSSTINYSPVGIGNVNETLGGCLTEGEHNSVWYKITIATGGTLTFNLVPTDPNADYDWAMYGPNKTCGNLGAPIRCNAATVVNVGASTGLNMTSTILSGPGGSTNPYCRYLDVLPGETYYLYLDNWVSATSTTMAPFSLTWGGTATIASPFNNPNLTPHPFVPPGQPGATPTDPRIITVCSNPAVFDMSSLTSGILNGNPSYIITYHRTSNEALTSSNPIVAPEPVNFTATYYYTIRYNDTANPNNNLNSCRQIGEFKFKDGSIKTTNVTLTKCNNNNVGTAIFDLTSANVYTGTIPATKKYYATMAQLNAGGPEIANPTAYQSAAGDVYVKVISDNGSGCYGVAKITLVFSPVFTATDANLSACALETNPSTGTFNLSNASVVVSVGGATKKYYPSLQDVTNGTNEISNFTNYVSPSGVVYVKVSNAQGCYVIAKITLTVNPQKFSSVLKDQTICIDARTTLDAGPGFDGYQWSTGETTSSISGVSVGTYWVKLKTGECTVLQHVKVYPVDAPVISGVEVGFKSIKVNVVGGHPPYQYSVDNINWQNSNEFTNLPRGDIKVYVRDTRDCNPVTVSVTVPNIVNVITANGDGNNDGVDFSALAGKKNLVFKVYNRYGTEVYKADKSNGYKWDGTLFGRKITTDTYWFSLSWNENDANNTQFIYNSWILIKNR